jgi:hypothetical protein
MRGISNDFLNALKTGYLAGIIEHTKVDHDLNLEIRDHFINLYYKGHSLLKLSEWKKEGHKVSIDTRFKKGIDISDFLSDTNSTAKLVKNIPQLKQNALFNVKQSLEHEYEQMIIRANNYEPKNTSEYFIVDRQYVIKKDRFDLTGFYWPSRGRRKGQEVAWCLVEVKFSLNTDIVNIDQQLLRYYDAIKSRAEKIAEESEFVFNQKLDLGLYDQSAERLAVMKTLTFSRDISKFQFLLVLVDYNPLSKTLPLALAKLKKLPFAKQIRFFKGGFAMWHRNMESID